MPKIVVVLGGTAGAGKDSLGRFLAERLMQLSASYQLDAYAYALKQIVHLKCGIPLHILNADKVVKESSYFYGKSVRKLLQEEGEYTRQTCGPTVWADRLVDRLLQSSELVTIVTDARHPNEEIVGLRARLQDKSRVFTVRVVNPRVPVVRGHPSEDLIADAPDSIFDFVILNDGTLDDLKRVATDTIDAMLVLEQAGAKKITSKLIAYSVGGDGWPYSNRDDAETLLKDCPPTKQIVAKTFLHLRGSIVAAATK